jgi:biopolymer transport protein TolR
MPAVSQRSRGSRRRMMNEINVVPYIDVMLVLLVIFMVTAPMLPPGEIELPTAGASPAPESYVEIQVRSDNDLRVRRVNAGDAEVRQVRRGDLASVVRQMRGGTDLAVMISADRSVNYGIVLEVLSDVRKQDVRRVGLAVKPE